MEPSVIMDTSPDYLQFAEQNPGFPVGFDDKAELS
jgi:hypothetical protein